MESLTDLRLDAENTSDALDEWLHEDRAAGEGKDSKSFPSALNIFWDYRTKKMPRFLEGKAGAKSLYNQFGGVATECHIF